MLKELIIGISNDTVDNNLDGQITEPEFAVFTCEINLKFRLIEEKQIIYNRDQLLERLLDAISCGADRYLEPIAADVQALEIPDLEASPQMRRQLIFLRNSTDT